MEVEVEVITRNVGRGVEWTNYNIIEYLSLRYLLLSLPALSGDWFQKTMEQISPGIPDNNFNTSDNWFTGGSEVSSEASNYSVEYFQPE